MRNSHSFGFGFALGVWVSLAITVAMLTCSCSAVARAPADRPTHLEQGSAAVEIDLFCLKTDPFEASAFDFRRSRGTGVIVDDRHVLTAQHVVRCELPPVVRVTTSTGRTFNARVEKQWISRDVARLEIKDDETFNVGSRVQWGTPPASREPVCSATAVPERAFNCGLMDRDTDSDSDDVKFSAIVKHGNSGSGLYDQHGHLIGIVTGGYFYCDDGGLLCSDDHRTIPTGSAAASSMRVEYMP